MINYFLSLSPILKKFLLVFIDIFLSLISLNISLLILYKKFNTIDFEYFLINLANILILLLVFFYFRVYSSFIRYEGYHSILRYIQLILVHLVIFLLFFVFLSFENYSFSIVILNFLILFISIPLSRILLTKIINKHSNKKINDILLIYGAGKIGSKVLKTSRELKKYEKILFIDDDETKVGRYLDGSKIYSSKDLSNLINNFIITEAVIATILLSAEKKEFFIKNLSRHKIKIKNIPQIHETIFNNFQFSQLKDFNNYDIIGTKLNIDHFKFDKSFVNKTILVTGGGGSIGSELVRQIVKLEHKKIIVIDISEYNIFKLKKEISNLSENLKKPLEIDYILFDIKDTFKLEKLLISYNPEIIFHTAAYKHVSIVEKNPIISLENNFIATVDFIDLSIKHNIEKFIYVSTDKAVSPKNIMGASKRLSELYIQQVVKQKKFSIVRFGNVVGSSGSVIPIFIDQIKTGGPITVTDKNATRFFMTIPDAASLILNASHISSGGEIFILDMGEPKKIIDVANYLRSLSYSISNGKYSPDDIKIEFIGLQNGEKLHEEIFHKENKYQLIDNLIFLTFDKNESIISEYLVTIRELIKDNNIEEIKNILKKIFPNLTINQ